MRRGFEACFSAIVNALLVDAWSMFVVFVVCSSFEFCSGGLGGKKYLSKKECHGGGSTFNQIFTIVKLDDFCGSENDNLYNKGIRS